MFSRLLTRHFHRHLPFQRLTGSLRSAAMAVHRGRIDLLEAHLARDPYPLGQATLLHMTIDFYERDVFDWLLQQGADVNARAGMDADGFGGHTPLFSTVVSQPGSQKLRDGYFTRTLLGHAVAGTEH